MNKLNLLGAIYADSNKRVISDASLTVSQGTAPSVSVSNDNGVMAFSMVLKKGIQGSTGSVGSRGSTGLPGPQGSKGDSGYAPTSPQGETGPQGKTRPNTTGAQGPTGTRGSTGPA